MRRVVSERRFWGCKCVWGGGLVMSILYVCMYVGGVISVLYKYVCCVVSMWEM